MFPIGYSHDLQKIEQDLLNVIKKFKPDYENAQTKAINQVWGNKQYMDDVISGNKNFMQKYTPLFDEVQHNITTGQFRNQSDNILQSTYLQDKLKGFREAFDETKGYLYNELSDDLNQFLSLIKNYEETTGKYKFELIDSKLHKLDYIEEAITNSVEYTVRIRDDLKTDIDHLSTYSTPHCYGKKKANDDELSIKKIQTQAKSLPNLPSMPSLARLGRTSTKVLIQRMNLQCDCLKDVLSWHYQQTIDQFDPASEAGILTLFKQIDAFQEYINQPLHLIKKSYLNHSKDITSKVQQTFLHHLNIEEQAFLNDYFRTFIKEGERLHKKLK